MVVLYIFIQYVQTLSFIKISPYINKQLEIVSNGIYMTKTNSTENQERCKIVRACLTHVPFDGWTQKSLELAANDCGFNYGYCMNFASLVLHRP